MKKKLLFLIVMAVSILMSMTAFAGVWRTGTAPNENRWWYDNEDGTWAAGGWQWIDGNQDGTAECYYFDSEGWMAAGTTTPDGYQVNGDGAWVENGLVMTQGASLPESAANTGESSVLVAYFSRTGTTEEAARRIQELTGADLIEIEAVDSYPSSYSDALSRAQRELDQDARPAVATTVENMAQYDVVYVGYPIWCGYAPRPVLTFLEAYDWSGKTVVPFCTSGSSGISASLGEIRKSCPGADVAEGRRVNDTSSIEPWLRSLGLIL